MTLPQVTLETLDGALGSAAENIDGLHVKMGVSSSGTVNTIYSFSRPEDVKSTLGKGPLPEALCHTLEVAGGPVYAVRLTGSVAGTSGSVTQSGAGPLPTLAGAPYDNFDSIVQIVLGGAVGTATFKYSLDGGNTWSPVITTAASYLIADSGVTVTFTAGTYVAGETYSWTDTAPGYSTTNLGEGFTALLADPREWGFMHLVGTAASGAAAATMATALESEMVAAATVYRYARAIMDSADDTDANLISAFAAVAAPHVMVCAGFEDLISSVSGRRYKRPSSWVVAARAAKVGAKAKVGIATHLGRVRDGALPGVSALYRDEDATPGLDAQRFTTLRTIIGKVGFFITRGKTMAAAGSDFADWHNCRVIDKACRLTRNVMLDELNESVRTKSDGTIHELDARRIEGAVASALKASMFDGKENVSAPPVATVDRAINVTSTKRVQVEVRIRPRGYLEDIAVTLGFESPATADLAA